MDDPDVVDLTIKDDDDDDDDDDYYCCHGSASQGDYPDIFCAELSADVVDLASDEDACQHIQVPFESTIPFHPAQQQHAKQSHPNRVKQASRMHQQRVKQLNPSLNLPRGVATEKDKPVHEKVPSVKVVQQQNASLYPPRRVATKKDRPANRNNRKGNVSFTRKRGVEESTQQNSQLSSRKRSSHGNKRVDNGGRFALCPPPNRPQQQAQKRTDNFQQNRKRPWGGWRGGEQAPSFANQRPSHWVQERRRNQCGPNDRHWNRQWTHEVQSKGYERPGYQFAPRGPSFHGAQWQARNGPDNNHRNRTHELHQRVNEPRAHQYRPGGRNFNNAQAKRKIEHRDQDANFARLNTYHDRKRQKTGVYRNGGERSENFSAHESSPRCLHHRQRNIERNWGSTAGSNGRQKSERKNQGSVEKSEQKTSAAILHAHGSTRVEPPVPLHVNGAGSKNLPPDLQEREVKAFDSSSGHQNQHGAAQSFRGEASLAFSSDENVTVHVDFAREQRIEDLTSLCLDETRKKGIPCESQRAMVSETAHLEQACKQEEATISEFQEVETSGLYDTAPQLAGTNASNSDACAKSSSELNLTTSPVSSKERVVYQAHDEVKREDVLVTGRSTKENSKETPPITPGEKGAPEVFSVSQVAKQETSSLLCDKEFSIESSSKKANKQQEFAEVNSGEVPIVVCSSDERKPEPDVSRLPRKSLQKPNAEEKRVTALPAILKKGASADNCGSTGKVNMHKKNVAEPLGLEAVLKFWTEVPSKSVDWSNGEDVRDPRSRAMPPYDWNGRVYSSQLGQNELSSRTLAVSCDMGRGRSFEAAAMKGDRNTQTAATGLSGLQETVGAKEGLTKSATVSNCSATAQTKTETRETKAASSKNYPETRPSGQCNFVIIDDSSDEDESKKIPTRQKSKRSHAGTAGNHTSSSGSSKSKGGMQFDFEKNFNYSMSQEAALEMQERMFREAAARVRTQASFQIPNDPFHPPTISTPMFDIHKKYPFHWLWKDPHACLGLPPNAPISLAKSQFRRLARVYHPDKSKVANTASKFHSITMAYRKLCEHHERL